MAPFDSIGRILLAYENKKISADIAAKGILDEMARTHQTVNLLLDAPLREAMTREV